MSEVGRIDFDLIGIAKLLRDQRLGVPTYQRAYSWGSDEIADYWYDLRSAFSSGVGEYFLGTIVLTKEGAGNGGPDSYVIDGQQRIATTFMLLAGIRNEFRRREEDDTRANHIEATFLSTLDLASATREPKLALSSEDNDFFRQVVLNDSEKIPHISSPKSHSRIRHAMDQLAQNIRDTADDAGSNWVEKLTAWVDFLEKKVRVICIEVPTETDAFLIFETLNDRGADLTIADLLKNYLFGQSGNRLDEVRDSWMQTLGALDLSMEETLFTTFLRHYWSSKYGLTRERELYSSIKNQVGSQSSAVAFANELRRAAPFYAAILSSDDDFWVSMGSDAKKNIAALTRFGLAQYRPLLLAAMDFFSKEQLAQLLRKLVSWSVRGLIVGGLGGGSVEKAYCAAATAIRSGEIRNVVQLTEELRSVIPNDEEFEAAFSTARVMKPALSRYYLLALERTRVGADEPELVPNSDEAEVNLEHVLPKKALQEEWANFSGDELKTYIHRLGNHVLLQKTPNARLGNGDWEAKKGVIADSALELTRNAASFENWDKNAINERQKLLANLAVQTWPA